MRHLLGSAIVLVASASASAALWSAPVRATVEAPVDAGDVVVVDANNRSRPINEGDSNTVFSVRVPDQSMCPGDSANDDWRVQSFIVPDDMDPGTLEYGAIRPIGDNLHALYGADTRPYVQAFLAQNGGPGEPGQILEAPPLSFGVFPAGMLPAGVYRIGVACTYFRDTAKFWDVRIELVDDPTVQPGQFRWRVVGEQPDAVGPPTESGGSSTTTWVLVGSGVVILALLAARARFTSRSKVKETTS